jgi:RND family efflux transporter MFP subunit
MDKTLFPLKSTSEAVLQRLAVNAGEKESERAAAKPRWRGKLLWGFVLLLVLGGGGAFAVASLNRHDKEALPAETGTTARDADAVVVTTEVVRYQPVQRRVEAVGTLYGYEEVSIAAKMDGRVRRIHHDVSDRVKPGDLLVEFDPTDYELLLRQAEKALRVDLVKLGVEELSGGFDLDRLPSVTQARERMNNARLRLDRARALARASAATTEDVSDKTADFRAADAEYHSQILQARSLVATVEMRRDALAIARQQLADMAIKVPAPLQRVPGMEQGATYVMSQRAVSEGSYVRSGTEVCKLVIDRTLKLKVLVPERYSDDIQCGQQVEVSTAAHPQLFGGRVGRINPTVDPANRTFQVEIEVPNPESKLKPGSFAKAAILTKRDAEVAVVPLEAVVTFAGITKIFLIEEGRAKEVRVALGAQTTQWVEIAQPSLPRGAAVAVSGQTALADGTHVAVRSRTQAVPASSR